MIRVLDQNRLGPPKKPIRWDNVALDIFENISTVQCFLIDEIVINLSFSLSKKSVSKKKVGNSEIFSRNILK